MSILNTFGLSLDASIRLEILYLLLNGLEMIDCCFDGYSLLYSRAIFRNKPIFPFDDNSLYLYTLNSSALFSFVWDRFQLCSLLVSYSFYVFSLMVSWLWSLVVSIVSRLVK
eukprot:1053200_1